jgi:hypothetical protein
MKKECEHEWWTGFDILPNALDMCLDNPIDMLRDPMYGTKQYIQCKKCGKKIDGWEALLEQNVKVS